MTAARYRKPVRDPIAGILSDWFGVENGSAKMLWALYEADAPLTIDAIAEQAGLSLASVTLCSGRLRKAGIDLPSQRGRRVPTYELAYAGRREVREALAHALGLLGRQVPDGETLEDALAELRALRAQEADNQRILMLRRAIPVQPCALHALLRLHKAPSCYVSVPSIEAALPHRNSESEDRDMKYVSMLISTLRKAMGADAIETCYGFGYRLTQKGLAMVDVALAAPTLVEGGFA